MSDPEPKPVTSGPEQAEDETPRSYEVADVVAESLGVIAEIVDGLFSAAGDSL